MKMYDTTRPVEEYLNVELECDCGLTHYAPVKAVNTGSGAIGSLPGYVRDFGYHRPLILCDKITYEIAGKKCADLLENAGYKTDVLVLKHTGFDEATLGEIVIGTPDDCDRFLCLLDAMNGLDLYDRLDGITCPVLVLGDENDKVLGVEASREIAAKLACEIHIYDEFSHAVYDEAPDIKVQLKMFADSYYSQFLK